MNIIEKLGMDTKGYDRDLYNISSEAVKILVEQRNEMLETLIGIGDAHGLYHIQRLIEKSRQLSAKATRKSWNEIKALL